MKHLDEYRDAHLARSLLEEIRRVASRSWTIMEVCGGQTHSLLRHGIEESLHGVVELVHGPGCPVCVTPSETLDLAQALALRPDVLLTTFGDMLRVPGSRGNLQELRAAGGQVRAVYSPLDAVRIAQEEPHRQVVFLAVGFETTAPATALAVRHAAQLGLSNFSILAAHVRVQPAMELICRIPELRVQGFLAAGHVCTVLGCASYEDFVAAHQRPVVVAGFEPVDLLRAILACVRQLESGEHRVENCYPRAVAATGNVAAKELVNSVYEVADRPWRGLGLIPSGGLQLRERWAGFDAERRFDMARTNANELSICPSGEVLSGRMKPTACPHFGTTCTTDHPLGAPMVSSEGACAAYLRYRPAPLGTP